MSTANSSNPIQISAQSNQKYVLCSFDQSKFILTANEVVTACQAQTRAADCVSQFKDLLEKLGKFVGTWSEQIHHALITVRSRDMMFLVVAKDIARNEQLNDALTDLEISVANDEGFGLLEFTTLCLPRCSSDNVRQFASDVILDFEEARDESEGNQLAQGNAR